MIARDIIGVCSLAWTLACAPLTLASAPVARAESSEHRVIRWPEEVPDGAECASQAQIERRIEEQLGGSLREADRAYTFDVRIDKRADHWQLRLVSEHEGRRSERSFEGQSCREVSEAAVLVIALSLDDSRLDVAGASDGPAAGEAGERSSVTGADEASAGTPPEALHERSTRPRWAVHAGALLELGALPRAAGGVELGVGLTWSRARVLLSGLGLPGVHSERARDGARVQVSLWTTRLSYCQQLLGRDASVSLCGGGELGRVSGRGVDLSAAKRPRSVWAAGWLALRLALRLTTQLDLTLEPALAVPLARRRFVSSDAQGRPREELHTPAAVSARIGLGVEARF
jgi:hypothetical protein